MKKVIGFALLATVICAPAIAIYICAPAIAIYIITGDALVLLIPIGAFAGVTLVAIGVQLITESETPNAN